MSSRAVAGTLGPWSRTRSALTNVSGGTSVMTLADLSNLRIVGAIDEAQIGRLQAGQQVDIRVDATPTACSRA
jgi:multidrug resistance efflux pump